MAQLHIEHRGLHVVEQRGEAVIVELARVAIFAVVAKASRGVRDLFVVGRETAAVAVRAERFERIEREAAGQSK